MRADTVEDHWNSSRPMGNSRKEKLRRQEETTLQPLYPGEKLESNFSPNSFPVSLSVFFGEGNRNKKLLLNYRGNVYETHFGGYRFSMLEKRSRTGTCKLIVSEKRLMDNCPFSWPWGTQFWATSSRERIFRTIVRNDTQVDCLQAARLE